MGADDVFPPEMPDIPYDTTERLLAGLLDPEDAPPGYAEVARVLRAAAGPPCPDELAGQPAALAMFRRTRHRARVRSRLVTVALAGTLALGGCGSPMEPDPPFCYCPPPGARQRWVGVTRARRRPEVGRGGVGTGVAGGVAAGWYGAGGRRRVAGAALDP